MKHTLSSANVQMNATGHKSADPDSQVQRDSVRFSFAVGSVILLSILSLSVCTPAAAQTGTTANVVYGQGGSFTTANAGTSTTGLSDPAAVAIDSGGNLYVADYANNRVLYFPAGSTTATRVYGQGGSFTTGTANKGGISANSLWGPISVALDSGGNLYVSDNENSRVLYYPAGSTTATRLFGQGGNFSSNNRNNGGTSAESLNQQYGIALDSGDNLYVADYGNRRVLYYPAGSTGTATRIFGQGGNFSSANFNNGGLSATSLGGPIGVALDSGDNLYVVDQANSRVLYYPAGSTGTATRVYGQSNSFTSNDFNHGGISANSLFYPYGVAVDRGGNLYVSDNSNNRVLYYPAGSTTATQVYGQGGSFTTNTANNGGVSANSLYDPYYVAVDSLGNLYVPDVANNRVLEYPSPYVGVTVATSPSGLAFTSSGVGCAPGSYTTPKTLPWTPGSSCSLSVTSPQTATGAQYSFTQWEDASTYATRSLTAPSSPATYTASFATSYLLTTAAGTGGTVSAGGYVPAGNNTTITATPSAGYYFVNFTGSTTSASNPLTIAMTGPISETANFVPLAAQTITFGAGPVPAVLGTSVTVSATGGGSGNPVTFTSATTAVCTVSGTNGATVTLIATGRCTITANQAGSATYLAAPSANQSFTVLATLPVAVSRTADVVYGQGGNFTSGNANNGVSPSANGLNSPFGVALDSSGNLYVADYSNNRVLYYPAGTTTATRVYGQGDFTTSSRNGLNAPFGVALDSGDNLYVADVSNNRVLYYPAGSTTATRVYGQGGSFTTTDSNHGGLSANSLSVPSAVALDSGNNLFVADRGNQRVLYYPAGTTTATRVYGQGDNFSSVNSNNGFTSATSIGEPYGVAVDSGGNLYVADHLNNRVLYYPAGSTTATRVYGQGGDFTTRDNNHGGLSANSLNSPIGVAVDSGGSLYVADRDNSRVLYYPAGSTTPTQVYGQGGSFTSNAFNNGGISATSLAVPSGIAIDSAGNLYVADQGNNRVLEYGPPNVSVTVATSPSGLAFTSSGAGCAPGSYTAPQTLVWTPGSSCTLSVTSPQTSAGTQYSFTQWENATTAATRSITAPSAGATYTATFATSYLLTTSAGTGGSVSAGGYISAGNNATITATPSAGYYFVNFTGSTTSTSNPLTITMTGPISETANFAAQTAQTITFGSAPSPAVYGTSVTVNATGGGSGNPVTFTSATTSVCTVSGSNGATVALMAAGTCTVTANQAGSATYSAAAPVSRSFTVSPASTQTSLTITPNSPTPTYGDTLTLSASVADNSAGSTGTPAGTAQFAYSTDGGTTWVSLGSAVTLNGSGNASLPTTSLPAGSPMVKVSYSGGTNFAAGSATATPTVNRKTVTVTGITASNKPYDGTTSGTLNTSGEAIVGLVNSDSITLGAAPVGTFSDANAGNGKTVAIGGLTLVGGAAGNYSLTQPSASANITQLNASVTPNAASKTYGQSDPSFSGTLSGFLAGDGVTATYSRTAGEIAGGTYTISATLSPSGLLGNYNITYNTAAFTISKADPTITWPAPAALAFGSALGSGQLNATASVPGTLVYTPPAGTVLPGGSNTLSVTFTPTDSADYNGASGSTTITINAAAGGSPANLVVSRVLTRSGGNIVVVITIANTGGTAAANVVLTSAAIVGARTGTVTATPLPQSLGTIAAGGSAQATVTVPGTVGASGSATTMTAGGTYTGSTFTSNARVTLP